MKKPIKRLFLHSQANGRHVHSTVRSYSLQVAARRNEPHAVPRMQVSLEVELGGPSLADYVGYTGHLLGNK